MKMNINLWVVCGFFYCMFAMLIQCSCRPDLSRLDEYNLIRFARNIGNGSKLNWGNDHSQCNWKGIQCDEENSMVLGLYLSGLELYGEYPPFTLELLPGLETVELWNNNFSGPFPDWFRNVNTLKNLHLHHNNFSGPLPTDFTDHWFNLTTFDISSNNFDGNIPESLFALPHLVYLGLANNLFSGNLSKSLVVTDSLKIFSLAYNKLTGNIPDSLHRFHDYAFLGNNFSTPYSPAAAPSFSPAPLFMPVAAPSFSPVVTPSFSPDAAPTPQLLDLTPRGPQKKRNKITKNTSALLGIIIGVCLLGFVSLVGLCLLILWCFKRKYLGNTGDFQGGSLWPRRNGEKDCV